MSSLIKHKIRKYTYLLNNAESSDMAQIYRQRLERYSGQVGGEKCTYDQITRGFTNLTTCKSPKSPSWTTDNKNEARNKAIKKLEETKQKQDKLYAEKKQSDNAAVDDITKIKIDIKAKKDTSQLLADYAVAKTLYKYCTANEYAYLKQPTVQSGGVNFDHKLLKILNDKSVNVNLMASIMETFTGLTSNEHNFTTEELEKHIDDMSTNIKLCTKATDVTKPLIDAVTKRWETVIVSKGYRIPHVGPISPSTVGGAIDYTQTESLHSWLDSL